MAVPEMYGLKKKRPTIGLLISRLADSYHTPVWHGIADYTRENDINLICFTDRTHSQNDPATNFTRVTHLAGRSRLDGLLMLSNNEHESQELINDYRQISALPIISISTKLANTTNILIDNAQGMQSLLNHLIDFHGLRRLAFIRGTEHYQEAEARFETFIKVLSEKGLPLDPELIVPGNFRQSAGRAAVDLLLDQRKKDFDALVAANDDMALGAVEALRERGIRVPDDVTVVGFDDRDESRIAAPALTTVRQPLRKLGWTAAETLAAMINGETVPETVTLPTKLIIRQSCGCSHRPFYQAGAIFFEHQMVGCGDIPANAGEMEQSFLDAGSFKALVTAIRTEMKGQQGAFTVHFEQLLRQKSVYDRRLDDWQEFVTFLRHYLLPEFKGHSEAEEHFENLCHWARVLVSVVLHDQETLYRLQIKQQTLIVSEIGKELAAATDMGQAITTILRELPRLKIKRFYLALFEPGEDPCQYSRLVAAYDNGAEISDGEIYLSDDLVPVDMVPQEEQFSWIVEPLYFREEQFGFVVLEMGASEGMVYEVVSGQLSSTLKGILFYQEQERAKEELARSNAELKNFAYIASHDLQEPLRMVTSYLQLLERRYRDKLDEDAHEFIGFAVDGANRMRTLINDLLEFSRVGTRGMPFVMTDCNQVLNHALTNLQIAIRETKAVITYNALPSVNADSIQLTQLFQNLIGNALKFHSAEPPRIHIMAVKQGKEWIFSVNDNGIGIDPQYFERIFLIFQRLHAASEYPGTGIGLAICKKIVERHGGRIWVESASGEGTTFYFSLPVFE